jgi:hypothetical protein
MIDSGAEAGSTTGKAPPSRRSHAVAALSSGIILGFNRKDPDEAARSTGEQAATMGR